MAFTQKRNPSTNKHDGVVVEETMCLAYKCWVWGALRISGVYIIGKLHIYPTADRYEIKILNWDTEGWDIRMDEIA